MKVWFQLSEPDEILSWITFGQRGTKLTILRFPWIRNILFDKTIHLTPLYSYCKVCVPKITKRAALFHRPKPYVQNIPRFKSKKFSQSISIKNEMIKLNYGSIIDDMIPQKKKKRKKIKKIGANKANDKWQCEKRIHNLHDLFRLIFNRLSTPERTMRKFFISTKYHVQERLCFDHNWTVLHKTNSEKNSTKKKIRNSNKR